MTAFSFSGSSPDEPPPDSHPEAVGLPSSPQEVDALTGLRTRAALVPSVEARLDRCAHRGRTLALLIIDIDRFNVLNEGLGHAVGDHALQTIARRLREVAGDSVWRVSGDEFAAAFEVAGTDEAVAIGRRISAVLAEPVVLRSHTATLTGSIGIAVAPTDGTDVAMLMQRADLAMRQVKRSGGGGVGLAEGSDVARVNERFALESDLHGAIARGELSIVYQPFVSAAGRRVTGAEALLRWRHPGRGDVQPAVFIEIAEESRLLGEIGGWVIRQACEQMAAWRREGLTGLRVAVNISPSQLSAELIAQVEEALAATGIPPESLELELTEGVLMADEQGPTVAAALRARGVRLSLDDFGTGYSSLAYLHRLRVNSLKIDRSFVESLGQSEDSAAITRAIIALAKGLGIEVLAEGVERPEQLAFLRSSGCDEIQGFLASPPLTTERFLRLAKARNSPTLAVTAGSR